MAQCQDLGRVSNPRGKSLEAPIAELSWEGTHLVGKDPELFKLEQKFPKWRGYSCDVRRQLFMANDAAPWTSKMPCRGVPEHLERVMDLLNCAWKHQLLSTGLPPDAARKGFWADFSQGVEGYPWGDLRTFCQGQTLTWSHFPIRLISYNK